MTARKQNVPDSFESWDARRTSPPPKDCSRASYPRRGGAGMARMCYWWPVGNRRQWLPQRNHFLCNVIALHPQGRCRAVWPGSAGFGVEFRNNRSDLMRKYGDVIVVIGDGQNLVS